MAFIQSTNKKEAAEEKKKSEMIAKGVYVFALILIITGLIKWDWEFILIAIVFLTIIPIFKFINWIDYNNAKMIESEKKKSDDTK